MAKVLVESESIYVQYESAVEVAKKLQTLIAAVPEEFREFVAIELDDTSIFLSYYRPRTEEEEVKYAATMKASYATHKADLLKQLKQLEDLDNG